MKNFVHLQKKPLILGLQPFFLFVNLYGLCLLILFGDWKIIPLLILMSVGVRALNKFDRTLIESLPVILQTRVRYTDE